MGVSNELRRPQTEDDFEAMCHVLYKRMWNDPSCVRVGKSGQKQFGVDILGHDGSRSIGVQCKHYIDTPFTLSTVTGDIKKAEEEKLEIDHLVFATTAAGKAKLVKDVYELSSARRKDGKFTVSVDFWGDLSGYIRLYPDIGREFIPEFPGSTILDIRDTSSEHLDLYKEDRGAAGQFQAATLELQEKTFEMVSFMYDKAIALPAGGESDPRIDELLDRVRDSLREGRVRDARVLLESLGGLADIRNPFSQFRWRTNVASIDLMEGRYNEAADGLLDAYSLAPHLEKAHCNRALALLLRRDFKAALAACDESLITFPTSTGLWVHRVTALSELGVDSPDKDVPESLSGETDICVCRARLCERGGDFGAAIKLLRNCLAKGDSLLDVRRIYLSMALSWAIADPVLAFHGQLNDEMRQALIDALAQFEPLEQIIPAIQSDHISLEVSTNVAIALSVVGAKDRARTIVAGALSRHPLAEGLLRLRLIELDENDDISAIRTLTDAHLSVLPNSILAILAEISANRGDMAWHESVMSVLQEKEPDPKQVEQLRILALHARWRAGDSAKAIGEARDFVREHPTNVLARVILGSMLRQIGEDSGAIEEARACTSLLEEKAHSSLEVVQVAELLYSLKQYRDAAALYGSLVRIPGNDEFTRRLLVCLIETDQRRRAQDVIERLPEAVRTESAFRRIQANLARHMGDWLRMRDLLAQELAINPDNCSLAVGYLGALYRLNDDAGLNAYLASDPRFTRASLRDEFEFAKYQARHGLGGMAIARLYRQYRDNSQNSEAASYFLLQTLVGQRLSEFDPPTRVGRGTVVLLRNAHQSRTIAIDIDDSEGVTSWPELVAPATVAAKQLMECELGAMVRVRQAFGDDEYEVVGISSIYAFAAQKAHELVAAVAVPSGPLWSVQIVREDGKLDVDVLVKAARRRKEHVQSAFRSYQQHRFPIAMLAGAIGADPVSLLVEWPYREAALFVGFGTKEERDDAVGHLRQEGHQYVLDLLTVCELVQRKCYNATSRLLGRPIVPQTVREHLLALMQFMDSPRPSTSMSEEGGQLRLTDTPPEYYRRRDGLLREMLQFLDESCDVVPTAGPENVTDALRFAAEILDHDTLDVLYLCLERNAVLLSEDGALRLVAADVGIKTSMGVQPVLMELCDRGWLSEEAYADAVVEKLASGHDFVSVRAEELLTLARRRPDRISEEIRTALATFRKSTLEIVSGVEVSCEFLLRAFQELPLATAAKYGTVILETLQHGRIALADEIHRAIATTVQGALQRRGKKLSLSDRRAVSALLRAPEPPMFVPRLKPVALAVQRVFRRDRIGGLPKTSFRWQG